MVEDLQLEQPKYKDLRTVVEFALKRKAELEAEIKILELTISLASKRLDLSIDLNGNKIIEETA